jgi:hypothetical protein
VAALRNIAAMISLVDNFELPEPDEPYKPGMPAPAADIEFWRDVFRALLPEDEAEG